MEDLEWKEFLVYNMQYVNTSNIISQKDMGVLKFEVGYMGLDALRHYCRLKYAYQEYYHWHQIVVSSRPTFSMTQMETISYHVVNRVHVEPKRCKQLMDYCQELAYLTDLGDHVMESWRVSCEFTKFQVGNAQLGHDASYLQAAILRTQHLVDKLTTRWKDCTLPTVPSSPNEP